MSCCRFIGFLFLSSLLASCASLSSSGVGRIRHYEITDEKLPPEFDSTVIAFISDIHYPSKLTRKRLGKVVHRLRCINPDIMLLGGDYVTSPAYMDELFDSLSSVNVGIGIYAVLGNHERSNAALVDSVANKYGIYMLNDEAVAVACGNSFIYLAGVRDSFKADSLTRSPSDSVSDDNFTLLLTHTPDYVQDVAAEAALALAGHTHGGQVSLFGLYTPVKNTHYGTRFLKGLNYTDKGVPVITTTGVGTSRKKVRFCVPSEIIVVTLRNNVK